MVARKWVCGVGHKNDVQEGESIGKLTVSSAM